jgi:uncharacterized protein (DUF305 family)
MTDETPDKPRPGSDANAESEPPTDPGAGGENDTEPDSAIGAAPGPLPDPDAGEGQDAEEGAPGHTRKQLSALLVLGAVALLLVGAVIGLLLRTTFDGGEDNKPAADSAAVGFAQDMIRHHQQAVAMATIEMYGGSDSQVRTLAYDILTQQTNQVGQMQSWLQRWGYPVDNPGEPMAWMESDGGDGHSHGGAGSKPTSEPAMDMNMGDSSVPMPGMASTDELARLGTLQGAELDTYFLQLMLRHHQGGLEMMDYAVDKDHVSEDYVRRLAQQMINTQESESDTMTTMLESRGAAPLPMN